MVGSLKTYKKPDRKVTVYKGSMDSRYQKYGSYRTYSAKPVKTPLGTGYVDSASVLALNTTGTIFLMNTVAQGASVNQRVGKKIQLKSIQLRGIVNSDTTTVISQYTCCIIRDSRPTGALPAITDIFVTISPLSMLNDANSARFSVIWRHDGMLIGENITSGVNLNPSLAHNVNEYIKIRKAHKQVVYKAAGTGAIADIDEGAFYFVAFGGNAAGTADGVGNFNCRTRYWDTQG